MTTDPVLELVNLPASHPFLGKTWLHDYAVSAVIRLSMNPVKLPDGVERREMAIDWQSPTTQGKEIREARIIGWKGLPDSWAEHYQKQPYTKNEDDITKDAALAVMPLLVFDLESVTVEKVLPIGSGGDYRLSLKKWGKAVQIEVSGVREDENGAESKSRLNKKCDQVLTKSRAGFASVTTFSYQADKIAHSFLHFVVKGKKAKKSKKPKKKP